MHNFSKCGAADGAWSEEISGRERFMWRVRKSINVLFPLDSLINFDLGKGVEAWRVISISTEKNEAQGVRGEKWSVCGDRGGWYGGK